MEKPDSDIFVVIRRVRQDSAETGPGVEPGFPGGFRRTSLPDLPSVEPSPALVGHFFTNVHTSPSWVSRNPAKSEAA